MKKQIILTVIFLVISLMANSECGPQPSIKDEWKNTHCIFVGTVLQQFNCPLYDGYGKPMNFTNIKVNEVFKGNLQEGDTVSILECTFLENYKFEERGQYVIFAHLRCGFMTTTYCQRTCPIETAEKILKFLERKKMTLKDEELVEEIIIQD